MFTKKDMISFAHFFSQSYAGINAGKILNNWVDKNPRLVASHDVIIYATGDRATGQMSDEVVAKKGTEFRVMHCEIPNEDFVLCDIVGPESPEEKCYFVPLAGTTRKI